jgi:hypothetical protein
MASQVFGSITKPCFIPSISAINGHSGREESFTGILYLEK